MKVLKLILISIVSFFAGLFLIGFVIGLVQGFQESQNVPAVTQQAKDTTARNGFISGCTEGGGVSYAACSCGYDRLLAMHPDFNTNEAITKRILAEGYNQAETNAIVSCMNVQSL